MLDKFKQKSTEIAASTALVIGLSGCAGNPTWENIKETAAEYDKTLILAGAGAAAGAVIDHDKRARGAVIGATAAAAGGYYWDRLEKDLRETLRDADVTVIKTESGLQLEMNSDITFDKNSSEINSGYYKTLNAVSKVLEKYDDTQIQISGYTDSSGPQSYNQDLSERRAGNVEKYLNAQGVNANRTNSNGYGEKYADQSRANPADRRVEIDLSAE